MKLRGYTVGAALVAALMVWGCNDAAPSQPASSSANVALEDHSSGEPVKHLSTEGSSTVSPQVKMATSAPATQLARVPRGPGGAHRAEMTEEQYTKLAAELR